MTGYIPSQTPVYVSGPAAGALISEVQPTTLAPQTLIHVNNFLDELLYSLIAATESLNPIEIRSTGVPAVYTADKPNESTASRGLGRSGIGEAEVELRSWIEANGSLKGGFGQDGRGTGMLRGRFAVQEAFQALRGKCEEFSTLAPEESSDPQGDEERLAAWVAVGGSSHDLVLTPCALYVTALLEHTCEHVLASLARVTARNSDVHVASPEDLLTAFAEDEAVWGFYKRYRSRAALEDVVKSRQKRSHGSRASDRPTGRVSVAGAHDSQTSLVHSSSSGAVRDQEKKSSLPPSYDPRQSQESPNSASRKSPVVPTSLTSRFGQGVSSQHQRSPSVLSANTRNMIGAYNEQELDGSGRSKRDEEDDFDALLAGGETMKVSLTPSRLKNFDSGRKGQSPSQGRTNAAGNRDRPVISPSKNDELPALLPRSAATPPRPSGDTPPRPPRTSSMRSRSGSNSASSLNHPKLQARGGSIATPQETEELTDELESPFKLKKKANKESLAELLASTGPAPDAAAFEADPHQKRSVPAVILGTAPPKYDDSPRQDTATSPRGSVNRPGQITTDRSSPEKKRTAAREMADFFNDVPPPGAARQPKADTDIPAMRGVGNGKPKTSAQEMADFFNSTPPPSATAAKFGAPVENLAPAPAKKGFKGFISKIGGGSSKKDRKEGTDRSDSISDIPTASGSSWTGAKGNPAPTALDARKQRDPPPIPSALPAAGMAGVGSGTSARAIAEAYRQQSKDSLTATPQVQQASSASPPVLAPSLPTTTTPPPVSKRLSQDSLSGSHQARNAGLVAAAGATAVGAATLAVGSNSPNLSRRISLRKPVPYSDSPDIPPSPSVSIPGANVLSGSPTRRKPSTVEEDLLPDQPGPDERPTQTLREANSNDHLSFSTAQEHNDNDPEERLEDTPRMEQGTILGEENVGLDSVPEAAALRNGDDLAHNVNGDAEIDTVPEATRVRDEAKHAKLDEEAVSATPAVPSIPIADLLPLRQLLADATSVRECQLLLSAILTQWGVPTSLADGAEQVDSGSRIAAWLLAGRDGPVGDISSLKGGREVVGRESSEGTAVPGLPEEDGAIEVESGGVTVGGMVEEVKKVAAAGMAKVF